jgi:hypothetical protein
MRPSSNFSFIALSHLRHCQNKNSAHAIIQVIKNEKLITISASSDKPGMPDETHPDVLALLQLGGMGGGQRHPVEERAMFNSARVAATNRDNRIRCAIISVTMRCEYRVVNGPNRHRVVRLARSWHFFQSELSGSGTPQSHSGPVAVNSGTDSKPTSHCCRVPQPQLPTMTILRASLSSRNTITTPVAVIHSHHETPR